MEFQVNLERRKEKTLYNYCSAKKIYFSYTPSKYVLLEKKDHKLFTSFVSLTSRDTMVVSTKDGTLLFPNTK